MLLVRGWTSPVDSVPFLVFIISYCAFLKEARMDTDEMRRLLHARRYSYLKTQFLLSQPLSFPRGNISRKLTRENLFCSRTSPGEVPVLGWDQQLTHSLFVLGSLFRSIERVKGAEGGWEMAERRQFQRLTYHLGLIPTLRGWGEKAHFPEPFLCDQRGAAHLALC